jgi:DNA primase
VIDQGLIEHIKSRVSLATVVRQRVKLKPAGKNLTGQCPFHKERSASFTVYADSYYCFGCKAGGDIIAYVQGTEGFDFRGAIEHLAELAGVELEPEGDEKQAAERRRVRDVATRLRSACELAAEFYAAQLSTCAAALAAIDKRALSDPDRAAKSFALGYAPAEWDALARHLAARGVSPPDAEAAGLILPRKRGDGWFDRFRHRLMFPVHDPHGRVVGFSGYALPRAPDMHEALVGEQKYLNTPETPLFRKGELLFGLWQARSAIADRDEALLVEGNFDVVHMHDIGEGHAVAPLGSAFTEEQAELLRRRTSRVVCGFDADGAGKLAVARARPLLLGARIDATVVPWPETHDPDSAVRLLGADGAKECLARALPMTQWLIERVVYAEKYTDRKRQLAAVAEVLADETDEELLTRLCEDVARRLGMLDTHVRTALRSARARSRKSRQAPAAAPQGAPPAPEQPAAMVVVPTEASERLRLALGAALRGAPGEMPEDAPKPIVDLFWAARDAWERDGAVDPAQIAALVDDPGLRQWVVAHFARSAHSRGEGESHAG